MVQQFTVILAIVLIGYHYLSHSNAYKLRVRFKDLSNNEVFYISAIYGGLIFAYSWVIVAVWKFLFTDCSWRAFLPQEVCGYEAYYPLAQLDSLLLATILGAWLGPKVDRYFNPTAEINIRLARKQGMFSNLVVDVIDSFQLVQITTIRNKVYVGWLQHSPLVVGEGGEITDLAILPVSSGYRDSTTQEVHLTVDYYEILKPYSSNTLSSEGNIEKQRDILSQLDDLDLALPRSEIASIRRYSPKLGIAFGQIVIPSTSSTTIVDSSNGDQDKFVRKSAEQEEYTGH